MSERRTFLFLQGHPTFFTVRLGDALKEAGHVVRKINLSGQDVLFWPRRGADAYRGRLKDWPAYVERYIRENSITDVVYYADRHPYHVDALAAAKATGVRAWTYEFGYLRPDWLTLEPEAMGAFSRFPKDPDMIRSLAAGAETFGNEPLYGHSFMTEALFDIARYAALILGYVAYPHYRSDAVFSPVQDYYYWIRTLLQGSRDERFAETIQSACEADGADYTLLAMQLAHDYQIRASTHYDHLADMVDEVMASMAAHAPASRRLVVKLHPLDNGYQDWPKRIAEMVARHGLEGRVDLIRGGDLTPLIRHSKGSVMANSTVGLHCLRAGVSVKAMGEAVYDVPGLTHQGSLDTFWEDPEPVDRSLARDLVRAMAEEIQVKGSFYDRAGQDAAIAGLVERLTVRPYPVWASVNDQPGE
ncbi:MAG: capsular biosynthesis protein [Pseudomonadota bacterium]